MRFVSFDSGDGHYIAKGGHSKICGTRVSSATLEDTKDTNMLAADAPVISPHLHPRMCRAISGSAARNGHVLLFSTEPLSRRCSIPCSTSIRVQDVGRIDPVYPYWATLTEIKDNLRFLPPTPQCTPCTITYSTGPSSASPRSCASCNNSCLKRAESAIQERALRALLADAQA